MIDLKKDCNIAILDGLHGGLYIVDTNRTIVYWNKAAETITGFSAEEVLGSCCKDNILTHIDSDGNKLCLGLCPLQHSMDDRVPRDNDVFLHHKSGQRIPVSVRTNALLDGEGNVIGGIELFIDISDVQRYKLKIKELEKMALLDNLTQLPNRNFLERELELCFEERKRYQISFGVFFIDIDSFKNFNDKYGHDIGDKILQFIANTFLSNGRPFDLYGRWGGEEFIGLIRNVNPNEFEAIGNRIRMLIENSYIMHNEEKLNVTVSIGATLVNDTDDINTLIKRADELMYQSKDAGGNCVTLGSVSYFC